MINALSGLFGLLIRRPWLVLLAIFVVTAVLVWGASGVRLDGDLARLLPESARSVKGLEQLERVYGDQIGRITVIVDSSDPSIDLEAAAEALGERLDDLEGVDRVETRRPQSLLEKFRLAYLEAEDLGTVQERIERRIKWEKKRANPLFIDLGTSEPPDVDVSDIEEKYADGTGSDYYVGEDNQILVFVRPDFAATDLNQSETLVQKVESATSEVLAGFDGKLSASYTGRYVKRIEQQTLMIADIGKATSIAFVLLALLLLGYFRSFVTTAQVIAPLVVGTAAAMTIATVLFGSLNILTGFLGAILLGLGVDYGIHLVSRLHEERQERGLQEALLETFRTTGRANLFAGLTTAAALGSLMVSSFRAFFEFGVIALIGIVCILGAYTIVLPALAVVTERMTSSSRPSLASWFGKAMGPRLAQADSGALSRAKAFAFVILGAAVVVAAAGVWQVQFDTSFDNLTITDTPSWRLDQQVNEILGESQTPAVVLVEDVDHEARVVEALEERQKSDPGAIQKVLARRDLLPTAQDRKLETLRAMQEDLEDVPKKSRSEQLESFLGEVDGVLEVAPITMEDLPKALRRPFSRNDGEGSVVLVLPGLDLNDLANARRFVASIQDLPGPEGRDTIDALSDAMLLTEIFDFVQSDIQWMVGLTLVGLILIALLAFGPRRDALVMLGTLLLSLGAALGMMGLLEVDFNFINVMIVPIWLGLGVDASFHVIMHVREHPERMDSHLTTVGSVGAAFLTSMTGFGAMSVSHHNGLSSLASVAIVGLGTILVVNVAVATILSANAQRTESEAT